MCNNSKRRGKEGKQNVNKFAVEFQTEKEKGTGILRNDSPEVAVIDNKRHYKNTAFGQQEHRATSVQVVSQKLRYLDTQNLTNLTPYKKGIAKTQNLANSCVCTKSHTYPQTSYRKRSIAGKLPHGEKNVSQFLSSDFSPFPGPYCSPIKLRTSFIEGSTS